MDKVVLKAARRPVIGKQVRAMRREGELPAVLYGRHIDPTPITLDFRETSRSLAQLLPSALLTIELEGEQHTVLVREKQRNVLTGSLIHIDFQALSMKETLRTSVMVEFVGDSPAVKDYNAVLVYALETMEVECLPADLPERIVVNVSGLKRIGDSVQVKDITPPENVTILENLDAMLVVATGQEQEEEAVVEAAAVEPEVIEKGKKEEEEAAAKD